jgi:hypothetical protein
LTWERRRSSRCRRGTLARVRDSLRPALGALPRRRPWPGRPTRVNASRRHSREPRHNTRPAGRAPSPRPAAARSAHGLQLPVHDEPGNRPAVVEPNLGRVPEVVSDPDPRIGVLLGGLPEAAVRAHRRGRIVALLPSGKVGLQVWNLTRSVPETRAMTVAAAAPSTACAESWSGSAGWCRAGSSPSQPWTIRVHRSWASSFGEAHSLGTAGRVGECG